MKGEFIFEEGLLEEDPDLEEIVRELPIIAFPNRRHTESRFHNSQAEELLRYNVVTSEIPEEDDMPSYTIKCINIPKNVGPEIYEWDKSSYEKQPRFRSFSASGNVYLDYQGRIFVLSLRDEDLD